LPGSGLQPHPRKRSKKKTKVISGWRDGKKAKGLRGGVGKSKGEQETGAKAPLKEKKLRKGGEEWGRKEKCVGALSITGIAEVRQKEKRDQAQDKAVSGWTDSGGGGRNTKQRLS